MFNVEIYIDGTRADLFDDETIAVSDSIQDLRDISKIFTVVSKNISLPASKTNNKIFKHYYNQDVTSDFDARLKLDSVIKINGFDYRKGKLKLDSVKRKGGVAYSYNVTFFGETIGFRDEIGEDLLSSLTGLNDYNHTYDESTVIDGLELGLSGSPMARSATKDVMYPLITHTLRYAYDSGATPQFYDTTNTAKLDYAQLKPALRVALIIDEIEAKYGITFSSDFIGDDNFNDLFLWLHRNEGSIGSQNRSNYTFPVSGWSHSSGTDVSEGSGLNLGTKNSFPITFSPPYQYADDDFDVDLNFTITGSGDYDVLVLNVDPAAPEILAEENALSGNQTVSFSLPQPEENYTGKLYSIEIRTVSDSTITAIDIQADVDRNRSINGGTPATANGIYDIAAASPSTSELVITDQIPEMKIMDFLSGLFKMFNLTAYVKEDGEIYIDTLDEYYATGTERDITKYIDMDGDDVEVVVPYDKISFKYSDPNSILAKERKRLIGRTYGNLSYEIGDVFGGGEYEVSVPFEHVLFENLVDQTGGGFTNVLATPFIDENGDPTIGDPVIFYSDGLQTVVDIEWIGGSTSTSYANANNARTTGGVQTLNFGTEYDVKTNNVYTSSLFKNFWSEYIGDIYDGRSRIVKYKAHLPPSIILNYSLADKFVIRGVKHKINRIDIDLKTGESELELITE